MGNPLAAGGNPAIVLQKNEVHIWKIYPATEADLLRYSVLLSPDERDRASRFRFPHLTRNFIADHGRLRLILAAYTGLPPQSLVFTANEYGKPELANSPIPLHFNLSHTKGLSVLAVSHNAPVGIDVEAIRPMTDWREVAQSHFSTEEFVALMDTTESDQQNAFFRCWTRKEAFLKAHGLGLSISLDSFAVSLAREEFPSLFECTWSPEETGRWSFFSLDFGPGFAGALAISHGEWKLHFFHWNG